MTPDIGIANGIMSAVLNFAKAMPDDIKFDVVYFHQTDKTRQSDIEALGGRVYKIDKPSPKDITSKELNAFFKEHKGEWEALHIHAPHFACFIAPAAKKNGIKKICVHCHSTEYSLKGNSKRNEVLAQYSKMFINDKFACSKNAGEFWYGNKPFSVINNAIDCKKYAFNENFRNEIREELNITYDFVVGHVGRCDIPQKNHKFLIKVFFEIVKRKPNSILLLIGGEEQEDIVSLCRELNVYDKVRFLGFRNDIEKLLSACDVFLFPSTKEGLPVSIIEAQAAGLPILLSDSVTDEVCVTDLVNMFSLNESSQNWAEKTIDISNNERKDTYEQMQRSRWDLSTAFDKLIDYYRGKTIA